MMNHDTVIGAHHDIELQPIHADCAGPLERDQCILGSKTAGTTVTMNSNSIQSTRLSDSS